MSLACTVLVSATPQSTDALHLLDDPQEWPAFSRPGSHNASHWESTVVIEGMHCSACAFTVEDTLRRVPGVISAQVSAASRRARVLWAPDVVLPSAWLLAVQRAGYRAIPANDTFSSAHSKAQTRQALWRWLVAGLCMMQVMMYAYPAYIAQPGDLTAEMEQLLRWASWVLTLPVLLFSCAPFFQNAWRDVLHRRISMDLPVALGMFITFAVSTAGTFDPRGVFGQAVYFDSLTMFVFFLLTGRWLEMRLRERTAGALQALANRLPDSVERLQSDGQFTRIALRQVRVGDVLRVQPGEAFFADGVVVQGRTTVDEALLTGESHPLVRSVGEQVLAGSHNVGATVQVRVHSVGQSTRFAQIVALMESASVTKPRSAVLADRIAKPFLLAVLVMAAVAGAWWWPSDPGHALMVAVAVLVVTCPCAVSLATPVAMLSAAGALARGGVLVRSLQALDTLADVDTVVFDKTGTLTRDAFALTAVRTREGITAQEALCMAGALAQHSRHPVSRALWAEVGSAQGSVQGSAQGSSSTHWHCEAVTELAGQGVCGLVQHMPGAIASLHDTAHPSASTSTSTSAVALRLGSAAYCGVTVPQAPVLRVFLSDAQGWLATFTLQEDLRVHARNVVADLQQAGLAVHMLSGDGPQSVAQVAAQLGIAHAQGGCSPSDKLAFLQSLQAQGHTVAMVGDGLNDGPVLAGAHVAFALGHALPLAQAKADFVVLGEQLGRVVQTLHLARKTKTVVRQNLGWALAYNAACVPLAVLGWLPAWAAGLGMAASSLLVVLNALRLARPLAHPRAGGGR
jgi:Cu2+-exporting ATPase